jgi:hypothetical protein
MVARQHLGAARGGVRVIREEVPAAEHEILHCRERHELVDEWLAIVGALAEADAPHLRE